MLLNMSSRFVKAWAQMKLIFLMIAHSIVSLYFLAIV